MPLAAPVVPSFATRKMLWLVAVKRDGFPELLQIGGRRIEVVEGRLQSHKAQLHQPTGGVVDVHEQRAIGAATFEPVVLTAVYLDKLAEAVAPVPWLVGLREPRFLR